jgi:hypothetical protein
MVQTRNQSGITTVVPSQVRVIPLSIGDFFFNENDRNILPSFEHLLSHQVRSGKEVCLLTCYLKKLTQMPKGFKGIYPTKFFALLGE